MAILGGFYLVYKNYIIYDPKNGSPSITATGSIDSMYPTDNLLYPSPFMETHFISTTGVNALLFTFANAVSVNWIFVSHTSYTDGDNLKVNTKKNEQIGTGDGTTTTFAGTLANKNAKANTVHVYTNEATPKNLYDDGNGNFTGDGSGTINYSTGAYSITFNTAPASGAVIRVDHSYNPQIEVQYSDGGAYTSLGMMSYVGSIFYLPISLQSHKYWKFLFYDTASATQAIGYIWLGYGDFIQRSFNVKNASFGIGSNSQLNIIPFSNQPYGNIAMKYLKIGLDIEFISDHELKVIKNAFKENSHVRPVALIFNSPPNFTVDLSYDGFFYFTSSPGYKIVAPTGDVFSVSLDLVSVSV